MIFQDLMETGFLTGDVIPFQFRAATKGWREGEVGGSPDFASCIGGGDGDESEGDVFLFAEADGSDGAFFRIPEQAEVLMHARPLPAAIGDVFEISFFHSRSGFDRVGKKRRIGNRAMAQAVFKRHAQPAHMGQELDPWQEEPQACASDSGKDVSTDEIEKAETREQKHKSPKFAR